MRGFTVIEIMLVLAVVAITVTLAAPGFRDAIANSRLSTTTNNFVTAIAYARSEAIKRGVTISVAAIGGNWANGWRVQDGGGALIHQFDAPAAGTTLTVSGGIVTLPFTSRGLLGPGTGAVTLDICDSRTGEQGRQISISLTGRASLNREFGCS